MTAGVTAGGPYYLKNESAVASKVETNTAREYANWGGEFVDDALRFGEQPVQVSDDWARDERRSRSLRNSNLPKIDRTS